MSFIDKVIEKIGLVRKANIPPIFDAYRGADAITLWSSQKRVPIEKAMAVFNGWVYACIRAIAEGVASIDYRLFEIGSDGNQEEKFDDELLDILNAPNPYQTGYELKYRTVAHLEQAGNAYWLLDGVKSETDKPTAIYILNPKYVKVVIEGGKISKIQYRKTDQALDYQPHEILHFKYPDPNDDLYGIGTVQAIADWIDSDNYATDYNRAFFLNSARPDAILKSETAVTADALKFMKKSFEELYGGVKNASKVVALPKGADFSPINWNMKDLDFQNLQLLMRDKILAGFRVPKTILGTAESETNRATAETAKYIFAERTLKPKIGLIVRTLNEFLVPRYGENIFLDFTNPVPENEEQERLDYQAALGNAPYKSVNEVREEEGLPPIENGDEVMVPFNFTSLGKPAAKAAKPKAKAAGDGRPSTRYAKNAKKRQNIAKELAAKAGDDVKEILKQAAEAKLKTKHIGDLPDEDFEPIYKAFALRVTPYEKKLREAVQKHNADEKEKVLENLGNAIKTKAIDPNDLVDGEEEIAAIVDLVTPILSDLLEKEGTAAADLIGGTFSMTEEVRKALAKAINLMAGSYEDTTLQLLKSKLEEGLAAGAGLDQLKDLVGEVYEFSDEVRAERVARTEAFRVANGATTEAWKQSGVVKTIKWYTAMDERVCPFCAPLNGKVVSIDENFYDKGDQVEGADGSTMEVDYTDVGYPPLHPDCRCYVRPSEVSLDNYDR